MSKPRPLQQLLGLGTSARLIEQTRQLQSIAKLLFGCLDAESIAHIHVADLSNGKLLLHADSTAWATRLRYLSPQLLRCLQHSPPLAGLHHIEIRVVPLSQPAPPVQQPSFMSASSAAIIDSNADSLSDSTLRAALKRLARRGRSKSSDS